MPRWLKILLITVFTILSPLFTAAIAFTQLYGGRLKEILVEQINRQLLTKVEITGSVEFVLWKNFPDVSVRINSLIVHGSPPYEEKRTLVAEKVYLKMSLFN